jgi:serine protease Do
MSSVKTWRRAAFVSYCLAGLAVVCAGYASATAAANLAAMDAVIPKVDQGEIQAKSPVVSLSLPPGQLDLMAQMPPDWGLVGSQVMPSVVSIFGISKSRGQAAEGNRAWAIPGVKTNTATDLMTRYRAWQANWAELDDKRVWRQLGAGFAIQDGRYVLTAAHVLDGRSELKIQLSDGSFRAVRVVGVNESRDVGVLIIYGDPLPVANIAEKMPRPGQSIMVVGSPAGYGFSVASGLVSGYNSDGSMLQRDKFMLLSAPVVGGDSGGPVFNARGEVVGVVSYGNIYCQSIPIGRAVAVAQAILQGKRY